MKIKYSHQEILNEFPEHLTGKYVKWMQFNEGEWFENGRLVQRTEFWGFVRGIRHDVYREGYHVGMHVPDYVLEGKTVRGRDNDGCLEEVSLVNLEPEEFERVKELLDPEVRSAR